MQQWVPQEIADVFPMRKHSTEHLGATDRESATATWEPFLRIMNRYALCRNPSRPIGCTQAQSRLRQICREKPVSPQIRITREAMFLEPTVAEFPPPWRHCCPWSVMTMNTRKKCLCSSNYIPGNGCRRILARLRCTSIRKATRSRHSRPSASGATRARTCPPTSLGGSRVLQARGIRGRVSTRG